MDFSPSGDGEADTERVCRLCDGRHAVGACPKGSRVGQILLGKYRLTAVLGQGGMGTVYEARHELVGRRFAIKLLNPELALHQDIVRRFRREAEAAGALESENIAAVTDFGTSEDGAAFIVMEFLQGEDLSRLLARHGRLPVTRAVDALIQACRGLAAAHVRGIVHRDLKPENLFVSQRSDGVDWIKVLDFGIAKLQAVNDGGSTTRTGTMMGTPHYMPPEQARGAKDLDHRADIYALGAVLYELLSGQKAHPGETYNAVLYHVLTQAPARLETLRPEVPLALADVVHRAMADDAGARFSSVTELAASLSPFAGRAVTPAERLTSTIGDLDLQRALTLPTPAPAAMTPSRIPTGGGSETMKPVLRSEAAAAPRLRVGIGAAAATLLLLGAGLTLRSQLHSSPVPASASPAAAAVSPGLTPEPSPSTAPLAEPSPPPSVAPTASEASAQPAKVPGTPLPAKRQVRPGASPLPSSRPEQPPPVSAASDSATKPAPAASQPRGRSRL